MATLIPNKFSTYYLSQQEEESGSVFNYLQKCVLQNKLSEIAMEKSALKYDPLNPLVFAQREAELQGQMGIIEWLLATSDSIEQALTTNSSEQTQGSN